VLSNNFHYKGKLISKDELNVEIHDTKTNKKISFPRTGVLIIGEVSE